VLHPLARLGPDVSNAGYCGEARQRTLLYPGPATLPWMALSGGGETLALISLDTTLETIALGAERYLQPPRLSLRIVRFPEVRPGEVWRSEPAAVAVIQGDWHVAAARYRRWLSSWLPWAEPPAWVRDMPAWQLTIMRAQYGAVTWDYAGIMELWRGAQSAGIDTLFLFAWWDAGHDNRYPEPYTPSTLMGGQEELVRALRAVEEEGGHTILYTQGRLIDPMTPFYRREGAALAVKSIWGSEYREQYNFWNESAALAACSGKAFVMACPSHERWRDVLLEQGRQARGLGAGGVLYDQIGGAVPPYLCYDRSHPHSRPSTGFARPMVAHMGQVRAALKQGRPDFAVVTENLSDVLCSSYDIIHGGGFGSRAAPESFPELLRYTLPQLIVTNRMVGVDEQPDLAYAMAHGLRFDLEPSGARGHMGMHPELAARVGELCALRRALAPSLLRGAYADDEGLDAGDERVLAKAFVGDGQAAVVCWNRGEGPAAVSPRLAGSAPGRAHILDPHPDQPAAIAPGGLGVFVYDS
jgi:hypothetical protein